MWQTGPWVLGSWWWIVGSQGPATSKRYKPRMKDLPWIACAVLAAPAAFAQAPAAPSSSSTSSVYISADEIAGTLDQSIKNNVVDQPIKAMDVVAPSGHRASLAMLRRTKEETSALIHERVTE